MAVNERAGGRGGVVVISGPDGSGKSSLADGLASALAAEGPVRRYHHVFRMIPPSRAARRPTTEPHGERPYPAWLSVFKTAYLYVGHVAGWYLRVRPFVRDGGWVLLERGWWDMVVDPRRYRLRSGSLARRLAPHVPHVDRTFILDASPDVIGGRSTELERPELTRQLDAWRTIAAADPRAIVLDAARPLSEVTRAAVAALPQPRSDPASGATPRPVPAAHGSSRPVVAPDVDDRALPETGRWVALPPLGRARWTLPSTPRRSARASLTIHQPMRVWARGGWELARSLAGIGAFRLLPAVPPPVLDAELRQHIPPGGSFAVAHLARPGRAVALVLDRDAQPRAVAKIAHDPAGREKLAREAANLEHFGALLEPPLRAPALLAVGDGAIVLEAPAWRPRLRPSQLEPDLAAAIGRFHRSAASLDARGPIHGDFAPWNVLRIDGGWLLIDWEEARAEGPAFWDPLHFLVQGMALLGRPRIDDLLAGLRGRGRIGRALTAYAEASGAPLDSATPVLADYLVASQADLRPDRREGRAGIAVRRALLGALGCR